MKYFYWILGAIVFAALSFFVFVRAFSGRLIIDPILQIGSVEIRLYGLILAAAILVSYFVARKQSWKFGIQPAAFDDFVFWLVLVGVIGARLYFVLFNLSYFSTNLPEIYKIWHGGLSIYGSVLAGLIFCFFYTRNKAYSFFNLTDLVTLSLPLGQAIGRLGNFVNHEAFGTPTNLPWKMYVPTQFRPTEYISDNFFHPTFLYEIILDLLVFILLWLIFKRYKKSGIITYSYLLFYSLGRFFIEGIRLDSFFVGGFRVDQIVALILVIVCGILLLRKQKQTS